jgi:3-hydroxymyristoyl/3-hydroxydecanoyl-(acyl carrier protein) dehydratase
MQEIWQILSQNIREAEPGGSVLAEAYIDSASPWFSGHFPNDPILPGIALLSIVTDVIRKIESGAGNKVALLGIRKVRFKLPVKPNTSLSISISSQNRDTNRTYLFKIFSEGEIACTGMLTAEILSDEKRAHEAA